ncbi:MAG: hypothetical protein KJN99_07255 [Marinicaulis sp.]|nr:hypothetical protein [Marinicaulis sp.]
MKTRRLIFSKARGTFVKTFVAVLLVVAVSGMGSIISESDIRVSVEQQDGGVVRLTYDIGRARRQLIFGELDAGHRERRWKIETPGVKLVRLADGDRIHRITGERFNTVTLTAAPDLIRIPKNYQPLSRYGDGGVMFFTGHFWPVTTRGGRVNTTFSFTPADGSKVVAFGKREDRLTDWRSPLAHPAFVYMGPLEPVETPDVMAVVDPDAPAWIEQEFYELTPKAFAHLADIFGFTLLTKPNLFLAAPLGPDESRLSYSGDALPAQFQITLEGRAWQKKTGQTVRLFRRSTIHEAVHLWQAVTRPTAEDVAEWIHEGAAEAIAAEVMTSLDLWTKKAHDKNFSNAQETCARELEKGSLDEAEERGDYRALYACGHVIAVAVAYADGSSTAAFWNEFVQRGMARDGYTEEMFYDLVEERTGDRPFTERLRLFVTTQPGNAARAIDDLLGAAVAPLAQGGAR